MTYVASLGGGTRYALLDDWRTLLAQFPEPPNHCLKEGARVRRMAPVGVGTQPLGGVAGTVIGCLAHPGIHNVAYVVEWDDQPGLGVMVIETRVRSARENVRSVA